MRAPADMPPRRPRRTSGRGRIVLIVAAVVLFVLFTSLRGIAGFYTDYLWFDSLGRNDVWSGVLRSQVVLAVLFSGIFALVLFANLVIADRLAPTFRPLGPDDELLRRYRALMDRRSGLIRASVAIGCGLLAGVSMSSRWQEWLLFTNAQSYGQTDPLFGVDLGFYMFQLPFLTTVVDWAFASLVIVLLITVVAHYLNGGIRLQSPIERVTPQVKAHVSVLLGILALVKAADYWLDRYNLLFSTRGAVQGATYTDVNAQLPAIYLLLAIALLSFGLFIVNIRRRGWVLPVVAVGLWAFVALLAGTAYPAFVQRFQVVPAQSSKEAPYVQDNIDATRQGMGLQAVERERFEYEAGPEVGRAAVLANLETIRNAQLLDPEVVLPTFQRLQQNLGFYRIPSIDVDRYPIRTGQDEVATTQSLIAARELNPGEIPGGSWENDHLVYTHGYGLALSAANATTANGAPNFLVQDIPVTVDSAEIDVQVDRPELYVGEQMGGYAIVGTSRDEVAYLAEGETVPFRYDGTGGVPIGSFLNKAAFALRFGDWNPLVSDFITDESKIIYIRDVRDRVQTLAPFLSLDSDPYLVAADKRLYYVVDAYTTSDSFPYGQTAATDDLPPESGLRQQFTYVRNSVKVVVDAYDGTVDFYAMDDQDPVLRTWSSAFPGMFRSLDDMSSEIRNHLRYPQDLFRVQTTMWGRYHIDQPQEFLEQTNGWDVAQDPGQTPVTDQQDRVAFDPATQQVVNLPDERIAPYYQILRTPNDRQATFVQLRTYVPRSGNESSQKLTAFITANSDPDSDRYGVLTSYEMPSSLQISSPPLVQAQINNTNEVAQTITLLDQQGSNVRFGQMLLLPLDDTILYVRPLYVSSDTTNQVPQLRFVIAVYEDEVVMEPTLREALETLFGVETQTFENTQAIPGLDGNDTTGDTQEPEIDEPVTPEGETTVPPTGEPGDVASELADIEQLLADAEAALRSDGDLGAYQAAVQEAQRRLDELSSSITSATTTPPETTTTTTTAPTSSA